LANYLSVRLALGLEGENFFWTGSMGAPGSHEPRLLALASAGYYSSLGIRESLREVSSPLWGLGNDSLSFVSGYAYGALGPHSQGKSRSAGFSSLEGFPVTGR